MESSYRAQISINDGKLICKMSDSLDVYDAEEFAKQSVSNWLDTYKDSLHNINEAEVIIGSETLKIPLS